MKNKKKSKFQIKPKHLFTIFLIISIALIATTFFYEGAGEPIKTAFSKVIVPLQRGTNAIGASILAKQDEKDSMEELQKENDALKKEIEALKEWNQSISTQIDALERLEDLYDLDQTYKDYPKIAAKVIGKNSGNWFRQFTIDKGTADGITVGMNVIATGGLVGIVSDCGENYAVVRTIIDDETNVSAVASAANANCIVEGSMTAYHEGYLTLSQLSKDAEVADGAAVITSQISSDYLPGILIGYVTELKNDKNNLTKSGKVTLAVDFSQINEVFVLTTRKEDYIAE
ncbi:MAG: rod shape-determining protein MreC [Lachnospiraceae bacterium]|nr:rod shape-determining protein MreC [Lachnospiraceae bacterium]